MNVLLKEITQISIYLKEEAERVNEVALLHPLMRQSYIDEESKPIAQRTWSYTTSLPFYHRILVQFQSFIFRHFPAVISSERLTKEAKFKTVLALLLAQREVRDFFLGDSKRQTSFYRALQEASEVYGYHPFLALSQVQEESDPLKISQILTRLEGKNFSLIEESGELNLQMAAISGHERSEILYSLLNRLERPPIRSVVEITLPDKIESIFLTTIYAKYKITQEAPPGTFHYTFAENQATSSISTHENILPDAKGAMNQRLVRDSETAEWISSYCGQLSTPFHALEQILLILGEKGGRISVVDAVEEKSVIQDIKILFTSLYSWHELELITQQRSALRLWDQKIVKLASGYARLHLLYFNIPFNALNKFPTPAETKALLQDINDETLIILVEEAWKKLGLESQELQEIAGRVSSLRFLGEKAFLEREKALLEEIDAFRKIKPTLLHQLKELPPTELSTSLHALLRDKKTEEKRVKGIDKLLYLNYLAKEFHYFHNKNCQNATDRSAGADAADKAQYAYKKICQKPFLPGLESEEEKALFKVLYSMYLVWEEPEINTALSTGFLGEKFYNNFVQKNPETTRYLIRWLKKHPETYLGLSDYRT